MQKKIGDPPKRLHSAVCRTVPDRGFQLINQRKWLQGENRFGGIFGRCKPPKLMNPDNCLPGKHLGRAYVPGGFGDRSRCRPSGGGQCHFECLEGMSAGADAGCEAWVRGYESQSPHMMSAKGPEAVLEQTPWLPQKSTLSDVSYAKAVFWPTEIAAFGAIARSRLCAKRAPCP